MNHLHLPVQSGNNRILELMRRHHTVEYYEELIEELKSAVPGVALSTDIIVGFPGETRSQFEDTLQLMERIGYSNSYIFAYSPRPNTPALEFEDNVPDAEKSDRLQATIELQHRLSQENGQRFVGQTVEVLIEGRSGRHGARFKGRNPEYWMVLVSEGEGRLQPGQVVPVRVDEVLGHALKGRALVQ